MNVYLKVKIKSLAAEAAIIRKEERRHRGDTRTGLYLHRVNDVRYEARAALLAYAFLRGRPLARVEAKSHRKAPWPRVEQLVKKYGTDDMRERMQRFSEWKDAPAS